MIVQLVSFKYIVKAWFYLQGILIFQNYSYSWGDSGKIKYNIWSFRSEFIPSKSVACIVFDKNHQIFSASENINSPGTYRETNFKVFF